MSSAEADAASRGQADEAAGPSSPEAPAPAPESRRFRILRETFARAVRKGGHWDADRLVEAFPGLSEEELVEVGELLQQSMAQYARGCMEEFEALSREYDQASKLADLERLCAERGVLEGIPPEALAAADAPGPRAEVLRAQHGALTKEREILMQLLAAAQEERASAEAELSAQRAEVERRLAELSPAKAGVPGAGVWEGH